MELNSKPVKLELCRRCEDGLVDYSCVYRKGWQGINSSNFYHFRVGCRWYGKTTRSYNTLDETIDR